MPDAKITQLPNATLPLAGTEKAEVVQGGVNKQVDVSELGTPGIQSIVAGTNVTVDDTDPLNPIVSASGVAGTVESVTGDGVDNSDPDNPVIELPIALPYVDTTGTAIAFAIPQLYNSIASPATGNVTFVSTGLVRGMVQVLYHNDSLEPSWPTEFKRLSGNYVTGEVNTIYMHSVSATRIEYTISQDI